MVVSLASVSSPLDMMDMHCSVYSLCYHLFRC